MSWKATAYVKDITENITPSEKLLLFVLADYHNTAHNIAWPSMPSLATESLMSERNVTRLLRSLEEKGFIRRELSRGGHQAALYVFPSLDSQGRQNVTPENNPGVTTGVTNNAPGVTPRVSRVDTTGSAIRKERVEPVEPVKTTGVVGEVIQNVTSEIPEWLSLDTWREFVKMRIKIQSPMTDHARRLALNELTKLRDDGNDPTEVLNQSILNGWRGLFPLGRQGANGNGRQISATAQRTLNTKRNIIKAFTDRARAADQHHSAERED